MLAHVATRCCPRHAVLAILMQERKIKINHQVKEDLAKKDTVSREGVWAVPGVAKKTANWRHGPTQHYVTAAQGRGSRCCCTRDSFLPPVSSTANFEAPMTRVHDAKHREGANHGT